MHPNSLAIALPLLIAPLALALQSAPKCDTVPPVEAPPTQETPDGPGQQNTGAAAGAGAGGQNQRRLAGTSGLPLDRSDPTRWQLWWQNNRAPYQFVDPLRLARPEHFGSDGFFLGIGEKVQGKNTFEPSLEQVREQVVPALWKALEEGENEIVRSCALALARIGSARASALGSPLSKLLALLTKDDRPEVREALIVSIGVLGSEGAVDPLLAIWSDSQAGRSLLAEPNGVSDRTRAFAGYALALLGTRDLSSSARERIALALFETLEDERFATPDVPAAGLTAIGRVPLDWNYAADARQLAGGTRAERLAGSLQTQVWYLIDALDSARHRGRRPRFDEVALAQAPIGLVRLLQRVPADERGEWKGLVAHSLLRLVAKHSKACDLLRQSAALALGELADGDLDEIDAEVRTRLRELTEKGDLQTRGFALIGLGKIAARGAQRGRAPESLPEVRSSLLAAALGGSTPMRGWSQIALGLQGHAALEGDLSLDPGTNGVLRSALQEARGPSEVASLALCLGLRRDLESADLLLARLDDLRGADEARGMIAVALGMIGDRRAIPALQTLLRESRHRGELFERTALALGLIGDAEVIPLMLRLLSEARTSFERHAIASAIGRIRDRRAIDGLVERLTDPRALESERAAAASALGAICDKDPLPWTVLLSEGLSYRAAPPSLRESSTARGVLDLR